MIWYFFGTETVQPRAHIAALTKKFLAKNPTGAGLTMLDCGDGASVHDVRDALVAQSLFTQRRLVVIKNPFSFSAQEQRTVAEIIPQIHNDDVVVFWEQQAVRTNAVLHKTLHAHAKSVKEFLPLSGAALAQWLMRRAAEIVPGTNITPEGITALLAGVGAEMARLEQELFKLCAWCNGMPITPDAIAAIVPQQEEVQAFAAVEALARADRATALQLLLAHSQNGDPFRLFGLYAFHVRTLVSVGDCMTRGVTTPRVIAAQTGIKPFVVTKTMALLATFNYARARRAHQRLVRADAAIKSGFSTPMDALVDFVLRA